MRVALCSCSGRRPRINRTTPVQLLGSAQIVAAARGARRLRALHDTHWLDAPAQPIFDRLTRLAARTLGTPAAFLNVVDAERVISKSRAGDAKLLDALPPQTSLSRSLCPQVVATGSALAIDDARNGDASLSAHPAFAATDFTAYLGVPVAPNGQSIGTLCVIDVEPRAWSAADVEALSDLAALAGVEIARRALDAQAAEHRALLTEAARKLGAEIRKRAALEQVLAQAQKLEALGQLTGGIAHDFNNVLAAVSGALHVLERTVQEPLQRDCVQRGQRGVERATRLVRQLMGFARTQALEAQVIDLGEALEGMRELLQPAVGARVRLCVDSNCRWRVLADPHQLEVALLNLAINARDAMPNGGEVEITTLDVPASAGERPADLRGDQVAIRVRDSGVGMPADVLERAREPFFTTKGPGKGTGLGLAMVHGFAQQSGGALRVDSLPGEGTTVTIYLPRADDEAALAGVAAPPTIDRNLHGRATILVVDDDALVRPVAAQYLRDLGYAVVEAEDALHALALAEAASAFDLVLTDVVMPGLDGVALAAQLRAAQPGLPVLMMTGHADRGRLAGEDVLEKPFTQAQLAAHVLRLLGRASVATLAARIKNPALRALYESWSRVKTATALPLVDALDLDHCAAPDRAFVAEITSQTPFAFRRTRVGAALTRQLGRALENGQLPDEADEAFAGLEGAYRRCVRLREASYEYVRFRLGSGAPVLFERLLLPCADDDGLPNRLVGMVMLENLPQP
jgi:signal transduction histidine kinase/CheY-like chemotaxis protein